MPSNRINGEKPVAPIFTHLQDPWASVFSAILHERLRQVLKGHTTERDAQKTQQDWAVSGMCRILATLRAAEHADEQLILNGESEALEIEITQTAAFFTAWLETLIARRQNAQKMHGEMKG